MSVTYRTVGNITNNRCTQKRILPKPPMRVNFPNMQKQDHWENIYATKGAQSVSWFREHLEPSLELIRLAQLDADAHIIDVGGGASTLVDDLLDEGFSNLTVLDISATALEKIKERLGDKAAGVT